MTIPMIFPDDAPRARRTDPVTSHEAADATSGHVWESQQATLEILRAHGKPATALQVEQIAAVRELPHSPSRMRSTLSELEALGFVERVGFTSPPRGRRRQLWGLTGKEA
ncbi:hypothetical protein [Microbacterium sp. gxy059]|uniref:hypothetical protein n=1 Tax=Microbacterium sp. gxy059 TaxID=2957199 RepID=UPI003D97920C